MYAGKRIVLVRHGRTAHVHRGGWLDAAAVARWRDACDAVGIGADERPPAALRAEGERAALVVASDLPRAAESAERIVPGRVIHTSVLLREAPLQIPPWTRARLPLAAWEAVVHTRWLWRIVRGLDAPPDVRERCDAAADWLVGLASERSPVLVVTHGVFRRLLDGRLRRLGWRPEGGPRSYAHWSAWPLRSVEFGEVVEPAVVAAR
jgi:broad specificity phosphatase PhoE